MTDDEIIEAWQSEWRKEPSAWDGRLVIRFARTIIAAERERCEDELDAAKSLREYEVTVRAKERDEHLLVRDLWDSVCVPEMRKQILNFERAVRAEERARCMAACYAVGYTEASWSRPVVACVDAIRALK